MDNLVTMKNIYMMFGGLCANNNIDFDIRKSEVIGVVGDNAAGKSTLMKILAGVYAPTSGEIYFESKPVKFKSPQDSRECGIEMLFQDLALVPELDVSDNLFLGKEIPIVLFNKLKMKFLLNRNKMRNLSARFLKELEINVASVEEKVKNLSGGQMQSVAIARAIFFNAKIVILDEPTASISVKETKKVLNLITQLKEKGISVVIVSHRMEDIFAVADRIVVLKRGVKVKDVEKNKTNQEEIIKSIVGNETKN